MNKKIIIIASAICTLIIITCIIMLFTIKNENSSIKFKNNTTPSETSRSKTEEDSIQLLSTPVEQLTDVKQTYNVGKCINDIIQDFYFSGQYQYNDQMLIPSNLVQKLDLENGLKTYYIKKAYKAELIDSIIIYFTDGYVVNENAKKIEKQELKLTLIIDTEYDTGTLYIYGDGYTDIINYNDDISKTIVLSNNGFKVKRTDSDRKNLDEIIMQNDLFQNRKIEDNMYESDLVEWYYKDYKIQKAIENNQPLGNSTSITYTGNYNDGYTITENGETQYYIKPGQTPMDYEISE